MKKYYYTNEQNEKVGPVAYGALIELHQRGVISSDTPIIAEGDAVSTPYRNYVFSEAGLPNNGGGVIEPKKSNCGKWALVAIGSVVIGGVLIFALGILLLDQLGSQVQSVFDSAQTKKVISIVDTNLNGNAEAKRLLGDNIEALEIPGRLLTYDIPSKTTTGTLNLKGSKGSGILKIVREQHKFTTLELEVDGKSYDLLKP